MAVLAAASACPAVAARDTKAEASPRLALVAVTVNTIEQAEPIWVLRDAQDILYVPLAAVAAWRLKPGAARSLSFQDAAYVAVSGIPGVTAEIDDATQTLNLTVDPTSFEGARIAIAAPNPGPMTPSGTGAFLNYEVLGEVSDGRSAISGAFELGVFARGGTGSATFIARASEEKREVVRLETNWTVDDPERMRSMRFGDSISRGGIGSGPLRFGGFQIASNFATQPGYVTMALPTLDGSAAVPSVVDIYVNNVLRTQQQVASGPFQLTNVPVVTGSGDIRLVVRDPLGRETLVNQSYYAAPQLLRRGLDDYSYEVGFLRRDFARASNHYGAAMASATYRYGVSDALTVEGHAEATRQTQAGSAAANLLVPGVGIVSASAAVSRSDIGEGALLGLGFERRTSGLSFGAVGEFSTADYLTVGALPDRPRPRSTGRVFVGMPTAFGSIAGSFLWREGRGQPDAAFLGANASVRLAGLGSMHLAARQSFTGERESAGEIYLNVPLGRRTGASAGLQARSGGTTFTADLQRNLPQGSGFGFRASASIGEIDRASGLFRLQTGFGNLDAEVAWIGGRSGARITASGSLVTLDGQWFASRRLDQSFALVRIDGYPNVRIYSDNQVVGRTNRAGIAVVPRLRAFQDNRIRIEPEDLPLDATVSYTERAVRPFDRSGVVVRFDVTQTRGAMMTVVTPGGEALPAGTTVLVNGGPEEFVAAPGGQLFLTGLLPSNVAVAMLGERQCSFAFAFAADLGAQPQLGQFTCAMP